MNEKQVSDSLANTIIPAHLHGGIIRYVAQGIRPGGFLSACIAMDTAQAMLRAADETTKRAIPVITTWFLTEAPLDSCGSSETLEKWIRTKLEERKAVRNAGPTQDTAGV